jgi:transposase-like protein
MSGKYKRFPMVVTPMGRFDTLAEAAQANGVNVSTVRKWMKQDAERASLDRIPFDQRRAPAWGPTKTIVD